MLQRSGPDIEKVGGEALSLVLYFHGVCGLPLFAVLISLGYAKLPVPVRGGASGGLPSFFKGVQRDQFVLIQVRRVPPLNAVASQCLLISWVSWVVLLQERFDLLEAYLPSQLAIEPMCGILSTNLAASSMLAVIKSKSSSHSGSEAM